MKTTKALFSSALILGAGLTAVSIGHASVAVGTNSEGFLTGKIGFQQSDNIFLTDTNEKSSGIFTLEPGFDVEFGTDALTVNTFSISEEFLRFTSASDQNNELLHVNYDGTFEGPPYRISLTMGFNQFARNTRDAVLPGTLAESELFDVDSLFEWSDPDGFLGSPFTDFDLGIAWEEGSYKPSEFRDHRTLTLPINAYYELSSDIDLSVGYRYVSTSQRRAADSQTHFFNVGVRGQFSPQLTGTVRAGYLDLEIDSFGVVPKRSAGTVGIESELDWAYSEKTAFNFKVNNDYVIAATGHTQEGLTFAAGFTADATDTVSLDSGLSYSNYIYKQSPREDDFWKFHIGGTVRINDYFDLHGRFSYQDNSSNQLGSSYSAGVVEISTSFRY